MKFGNETLYRLFVLVADEKSITRASEKLYISQPAVSKQIKKLENELNTTLFNRKNMELTKMRHTMCASFLLLKISFL